MKTAVAPKGRKKIPLSTQGPLQIFKVRNIIKYDNVMQFSNKKLTSITLLGSLIKISP